MQKRSLRSVLCTQSLARMTAMSPLSGSYAITLRVKSPTVKSSLLYVPLEPARGQSWEVSLFWIVWYTVEYVQSSLNVGGSKWVRWQ